MDRYNDKLKKETPEGLKLGRIIWDELYNG